MLRRAWRQFRPHAAIRRPQVGKSGDLSTEARAIVEQTIQQLGLSKRHLQVDQLGSVIDELKQRTTTSDAAAWFALLVVQGPRAARAQEQMDQHPHGYHNKQARLFELIDFNDTFVSTVLALSDVQRQDFIAVAQREIASFCKRLKTHTFSEVQFEAITRGLSREIAMYRGARQQGLQASMTSRVQDALGIDMVISDPSNGRSINIDCKTPSAYRHRLEELLAQGRITEEAALLADNDDYCVVTHTHDDIHVQIVLFCVRKERYGDVVDFEFENSHLVADRLKEIITKYGY